MRYLAVARLRLLTTIRVATPIFILVSLPPLLVLAFESMPEPVFRATAEMALGDLARAALFAWLLHAAFLVLSCEAFGNVQLMRPESKVTAADLMDSAPVGHAPRFWGEALGVFAATLTIHLCCLPMLAAVAALSPLPTVTFVSVEAITIVLLALASAGAAWKRLAPPTRWSGTRTARSGILFLILFITTLSVTTDWFRFRDALGEYLFAPSARHWRILTGTVVHPLWLVAMLSLLYGGYLIYYTLSTRTYRTIGDQDALQPLWT